MIENLPIYIVVLFTLTTIATLLLIYWTLTRSDSPATRKRSFVILIGLAAWLIVQAIISLKDIYNTNTITFPPKLLFFGILPAVLMIILLFTTAPGRRYIDSLPLVNITYINLVRIPVEIVLLLLFLHKAVPRIMTFEGRNFDILAGISAPFVAWFGFTKGMLSHRFIIVWNCACLLLLANIVINALLSAPLVFQKFAFEQPDIAILNFPFTWLPTFIVPVVLLGHLVSLRQLMKNKKNLGPGGKTY